MARLIKIAETWRESPKRYRKVNGEWRQVAKSYRKVNGEWKLVLDTLAISKVTENTEYMSSGSFDCGFNQNGNPFATFDGTPNDPYNPVKVGFRINNIPNGSLYITGNLTFNNNNNSMLYMAFETRDGRILTYDTPMTSPIQVYITGNYVDVILVAQAGLGRLVGSVELTNVGTI